jgi:hypothetical protein
VLCSGLALLALVQTLLNAERADMVAFQVRALPAKGQSIAPQEPEHLATCLKAMRL